jgi:hypothetical protein
MEVRETRRVRAEEYGALGSRQKMYLAPAITTNQHRK